MQKRTGKYFDLLWSYRYSLLIIAIGCIHRLFILLNTSSDIRAVIVEHFNVGYPCVTWQYLDISALTTYFLKSMLYLQQNPPIPNVIFALAVRIFEWPYQVSHVLIAFQAFLSIGSTLLLFRHLNLISKYVWLNFFISMSFLMSTDLLVMEYNYLGQTFYENATMFLVLLLTYILIKFIDNPCPRYSLGLGITSGVLALTRASFSYFFVVPAFFIVFITILKNGCSPANTLIL